MPINKIIIKPGAITDLTVGSQIVVYSGSNIALQDSLTGVSLNKANAYQLTGVSLTGVSLNKANAYQYSCCAMVLVPPDSLNNS